MTSKMKFFLSLVCIHFSATGLTMPNIDESKVKSFVVERRSTVPYDYFIVNMKTNHTCTEGSVFDWCKLFQGYQGTSKENKSSCSCRCLPPFYAIIPPMQTCINVTRAALFGDCRQDYKTGTLLIQNPISLAKENTNYAYFLVGNRTSCTLRGNYFDYSGFQSSWKNISDSFFYINQYGNIGWNNDSDGKLSGRIIRLVVTCNNVERCLLFKALGKVTYYAPEHSSTSSTYQSVSTSHLASQLPLLSSTPFFPGSLSSSHSQILSVSLSVSSQPPLSPVTSTPPPLPASSTTSPSSSSPAPPPSLSSLRISSGVQSETVRLPALTSTEIQSTLKSELKSLSSLNIDEVTSTEFLNPTTSMVVLTVQPSKPPVIVPTSSTAGNKGPGDSSKRTGGNNDGGVIGAAVGGAVLVGIIIIIILIFWKRRKAGKSTEKQGKQVKNPVYAATTGNEIQLERPKGSITAPSRSRDNQQTYQGLVISHAGQSNGKATYSSPGDEYDNCTVYHNLNKQTPGSPVYQSLMMGKDEPAQTITKPNSRANSKDATGLPKLKPGATGKPSQKPSVTPEPVYNVLDESGSDQGTTSEDLYNVLEGPDSGNDYEDANADGLYHALEGPNTAYEAPDVVLGNPGPESGPMHLVLFGPDANQAPPASSDEPLYNVVEGPDSDGTNQPGPNKPCPAGGLDNPSYEQTLELDQPYAAVQQPGTQRESLYQPLRGPTHDLYEALG